MLQYQLGAMQIDRRSEYQRSAYVRDQLLSVLCVRGIHGLANTAGARYPASGLSVYAGMVSPREAMPAMAFSHTPQSRTAIQTVFMTSKERNDL